MQVFRSKSYVRGATNLSLGCLVAIAKKETRFTALNGKKKRERWFGRSIVYRENNMSLHSQLT